MQVGMNLLFFLSPDKANIDDITRYLCGVITQKNRAKVQTLICHLRKNGWDISYKTYRLPPQQYNLVQALYREPALYDRVSTRAKLTPKYLEYIMNQAKSDT